MIDEKERMVLVRELVDEDLDFVFEVQKLAYLKEYWEKWETFQTMRRLYPRGALLGLVCNQRAGYLFIHPCRGGSIRHLNTSIKTLEPDPDTMYIHDICVSPTFQGYGVAEALLDYCDRITNEQRLLYQAGVSVQNSLPFWLKRNFKPIHTIENYAENLPGYYLERTLTASK